MQSDFEQFTIARERLHQLQKYEQHRSYLQAKIVEYEKLVTTLQVKLHMEQEDVDKLTKMSLTNLFYTVLRSKQEQLDKEKQEVLEASLHLQDASRLLTEYKQEAMELGFKLLELSNAKQNYDALMYRKEIELKSQPETALELEKMEIDISDCQLLLKELNEALTAGKGVHQLLRDASQSLEKAENWGNWDLWGGGGMISTMIKHSHVDEADTFVHNANRMLETFHKELSDLDRRIDVSIDISGLLKIADYWFDGLIVDWMVQDKIKQSQEKVLNVLQKINPIIATLELEVNSTKQKLNTSIQQRQAWIEQMY